MYLPRDITAIFEQARQQFPVVLLTGPRQTGKTEFLKHHLKDATYFSLDAIDVRGRAQQDPRSFFATSHSPIILDEIQEAPELLTYVKEYVDRNRKPGQVVLTGSHQFNLMKGVTESLAGRVAVLELLPFSTKELLSTGIPALGDLLVNGLYPAIHTTMDLNLDLWFSSYITTYLERDLRTQIAVRDMRAFETMLQLLAARTGQELNVHRLANDIGITAMTAKAWISALEAAYILYLLPPYFENFGKRLVKAPKLYFMDTGLACHLTGIRDATSALQGPLAGALFETLIVIEHLKRYRHSGRRPPLYFWRSHGGLEVDLLIDHGAHLEAVECKISHTVTNAHARNLDQFAAIAKKPATALTVVSPSENPQLTSRFTHCHWTKV